MEDGLIAFRTRRSAAAAAVTAAAGCRDKPLQSTTWRRALSLMSVCYELMHNTQEDHSTPTAEALLALIFYLLLMQASILWSETEPYLLSSIFVK